MTGLGITGISVVMLPFAIFWAILSIWLGRRYRDRAKLDIGALTPS